MSVTLKQIADEVGVSRAAVSHVLNGRVHEVSVKTRDRISQALADHDYQRNALVRSLHQKKTHVIGVVVPCINVSYFPDLITAIESEAQRVGYQCFLCQSHSDTQTLAKMVATLGEYRVDGLIISPCNSRDQKTLYQNLLQRGTPLVLQDNQVEDVDATSVHVDDVAVGRIATEHLLSQGHRHIAYVKGYFGSANAQDRYDGYCQALRLAGIEPDASRVFRGRAENGEDLPSLDQLLDRDSSITAIATYSDIEALDAMRCLDRRGVSVPGDISVIGCGNLDVGEMVRPKLTSVDQRPGELGSRSVQLLMDQIQSNESSLGSQVVTVAPQLVVRESVAPVV